MTRQVLFRISLFATIFLLFSTLGWAQPGDPKQGEALYVGSVSFSAGGAPCLACHGIAGHELGLAAGAKAGIWGRALYAGAVGAGGGTWGCALYAGGALVGTPGGALAWKTWACGFGTAGGVGGTTSGAGKTASGKGGCCPRGQRR